MENKENNKIRLVFYIHPDDDKMILNQCELLKISKSFFIRNAILEKLNKPVFQLRNSNLDLKKYLLELNAIGNNLNQIAKKLNSNAAFLIADQKIVLNDIEELKKHITYINKNL